MATQWRTGIAGPTGLEYQTLFCLMDRHGIAGDDWWSVFDDIREMESAALSAMR